MNPSTNGDSTKEQRGREKNSHETQRKFNSCFKPSQDVGEKIDRLKINKKRVNKQSAVVKVVDPKVLLNLFAAQLKTVKKLFFGHTMIKRD